MLEIDAIMAALAPELLLASAGLFGVLFGAYRGDQFNSLSFKYAAVTLFSAAFLTLIYWQGGRAFDGLVTTTPYVNFAKCVSYLSAGLALLMAEGFLQRHRRDR